VVFEQDAVEWFEDALAHPNVSEPRCVGDCR
jgi:hypothetical protein